MLSLCTQSDIPVILYNHDGYMTGLDAIRNTKYLINTFHIVSNINSNTV